MTTAPTNSTTEWARKPRGILQVEALGYRSLRYVAQELRPFQILVGANASGKSTFLDVVSFLGDLVRTDLDTAVRGDARLEIPLRAPDPKQLTWLGEGKAIELAVSLAVPDELRGEKNGGGWAQVRYEVQVDVEGIPRIGVENVWLIGDEAQPTIEKREPALFPMPPPPPAHIVSLPRTRSPKGWKKVVARGGDGPAYYYSEITGWNAPFALSNQKPALANLPEDRERFPIALWLRDVLVTGVRRIALASEAMRRPCPPTRQQGFLPDGSNLPYVISRLTEKERRRWLEHVREALPDIDDVRVDERKEDRHRYLSIRYSNGHVAPSWLVSDGTLRMLALTLLAYTREVHDGVFLIEEPENGIHPRAVETVFQALGSVYDAQVLLATHSPVVLGLSNLDDVLCFARTEEGVTDVVSGRDHPQLRSWKGGIDLGKMFAAGILG